MTAESAPVARRSPLILGGMGQSGVSSLSRLLADHPDILVCPVESCFPVVHGGLVDVVATISDEFSPTRADQILSAFERMLRYDLCSPRAFPFRQLDLGRFFGRADLNRAVDDFFARLGITTYPGEGLTQGPFLRIGHWAAPSGARGKLIPWGLSRDRTYLYHVHRLPRADAVREAAAFLESLYGGPARRQGKTVWCDQTTNNQQHVDFWLELFPDLLYLDLVRDPLDVALAHHAQNWASDDFATVCSTVRDNWSRWREIRAGLPPRAWRSVRFEDLAADPSQVLRDISETIGVTPPAASVAPLDASRVAAEEARRQGADLETYRRVLGEVAEDLGYPVP